MKKIEFFSLQTVLFSTQHNFRLHLKLKALCRAIKPDQTAKHFLFSCFPGFVAFHPQPGYSKTNRRSSECDLCGKIFLKTNLRRHKETVHLKLKNYECNVCGRKFGEKGHMRRHMLVKHFRKM